MQIPSENTPLLSPLMPFNSSGAKNMSSFGPDLFLIVFRLLSVGKSLLSIIFVIGAFYFIPK